MKYKVGDVIRDGHSRVKIMRVNERYYAAQLIWSDNNQNLGTDTLFDIDVIDGCEFIKIDKKYTRYEKLKKSFKN